MSNTLAFINCKPQVQPKYLVLKNFDVLVKVGDAKEWKRVSGLKQYDDGSFDILTGQGWSRFGKHLSIQVLY